MSIKIKNINENILLRAIIIIYFIFTAPFLNAQSSGAYLIPRQIYVGDPATFVLPLPSSAQNKDDVIIKKGDSLSNTGSLPSDPDIDFHRIILERRVSGGRLIIEFTAFVPGEINFPVIEIDGEYFSGLSIMVGSLINERSNRVLSGAASTLAMPGTASMLYGLMAAIVIIVLFAVWFVFKGRTVLRQLHERWKRYRLFEGIRKTEKRLQKAILKGTDKRIILDSLSDETRIFLSTLTGKNCRAMTAREFEMLPKDFFPEDCDESQTVKPGDFFRSCDELRFSGAEIESQDVTRLLADLLLIADALEKPKEKEQRA